MSTTATAAGTTATIVYRPLDAALGDADALAELRAIRARRAAGYAHDLELAERADARARAERARAERDQAAARRRDRRGSGRGRGLWGLLPA
ncbi:hypothetical protein [Brachybacterium huguangmaarense]